MSNIYDEPTTKSPTNSILITIDLSKKTSLGDILQTLKTELSNPDVNATLYIISGQDVHDVDYRHLVEYLKDNFEGTIIFRGYIHFQMIDLVHLFKCQFTNGCKVLYNADKLNKILLAVKDTPDLLHRFITRYTTAYYNFELAYLPLDELKLLGLQYETY